MKKLQLMLPILDLAMSVDEDFQQLDVILHQTEPLSSEQQVVVDRIASLYRSIENYASDFPGSIDQAPQ